MASFVAIALLVGLAGQNATGELRVAVSDPSGLPVDATVELVSEANQFRQRFHTDPSGRVLASRLPDGVYRVEIRQPGFADVSERVDIRSTVPRELRVMLQVAAVRTAVTVTAADTLVDPHQTGTIDRIGTDTLVSRTTALPGRSVADLVSTQPGWVVEANGVLHPRGSEYQTQYLIDGVPLTDNRSPAFLPDLDAENVQSLRVMTASYPAEYGRKLGGVVDIVTKVPGESGGHGSATIYGGSLGTIGGSVGAGYRWDRYAVSASGDAGWTDRYLDPPVIQNYTNHGQTVGLFVQSESVVTDRDRLGATLRRAAASFLVPNEQIQQAAGQRQERDNHESAVQLSYQRIVSPNVVVETRSLLRGVAASLASNPSSTPIAASQDRTYREQYIKGAVSAHRGAHDFKAGAEADFAHIHERFGYRISNAERFDPETPPAFDFAEHAPDREQAAFIQDLVRAGNATLSGGLRWDRYRLIAGETAWSPRAGAAYYWPRFDVVFRGAYDRVFQTPAFENLLVASSTAVDALSSQTLRLPVRPSRANFYDASVTKSFFAHLRANLDIYRRAFSNYADDDVLLNTGVSFPIAFRRASIHGIEARIDVPHWGRWSGSFSYSNLKGEGELPITGGLFLGDDASDALGRAGGQFAISQDQRHTVSSRCRYQIAPQAWAGAGVSFGSGLPTEFAGSPADALEQYGADIVDRVDFAAGRVRPSFSVDVSGGATLLKTARGGMRLQVDVLNVMNRLNVVNFAGLFSGTALGTPRRGVVRLRTEF